MIRHVVARAGSSGPGRLSTTAGQDIALTTRILTVVLRTALLVALMTSAAMFVDYSSVEPSSFCGVQSGCAAVRDSAFSKVFGIGVPTLGLGVFAGIFATMIPALDLLRAGLLPARRRSAGLA